ncbi:hypothetical protein AB4B22_004722 [Salmonella enterica]
MISLSPPTICNSAQLHTVERERVLYRSNSSIYDRIPTADMAFRATI